MKNPFRLGTRGSSLALYQAEFVKSRITRFFPNTPVEIVVIKTSGDAAGRRQKPSPVETKRIFTREIEEALLAGRIDAAAHSAKDLAVILPQGLEIGAVMEREDPRDCLLSRSGQKLADLPAGARIGTGSLRRKQQLLRWSPDKVIEEIHGNVETRIRKMKEGLFDAIVLALAGVKRLELLGHVAEIFPEEKFYPAPGQGVIAVQIRKGDPAVADQIKALHDEPAGIRFACERAFLEELQGGCQLPCGISTSIQGNNLRAAGAIFGADELIWAEAEVKGLCRNAAETGSSLARTILQNGGQKILDDIYKKYGRPDHHENR